MLLASKSEKNNLSVSCRLEGKNVPNLVLPLAMQQGRVMFKVEPGSRRVRVINFKGSRLVTWLLEPGEAGWDQIGSWEVNMVRPIDFLHLPHALPLALVYSQRDDCMTVLRLEELK